MGRYTGKKCRLTSMFALTSAFFLVEIVVGYVTNSMALVADSFHMLSDIAALIIAYISVRMAPKSWSKNTFGWARAEVLGALVNAVFLVALCFSITVESLKRFYEPEDIHDPEMILYVGTMGLIVNLLGLCLFHEHGSAHGHSHGGGGHGTHTHLTALAPFDEDRDDLRGVKSAEEGNIIRRNSHNKKQANGGSADKVDHGHGHGHGHSHGGGGGDSSSQMNMRGVFLHVLGDALGSVVVIISAVIMWQTDWEYKLYVDPGLSLVLVLIMMKSVWPLLIESALILLQTVPTHIEVGTLKKKLLESIDGVLAVHEFHVWQLTGDRIIASAHIRCLNLSEYMLVAEKVKEFFHNEGIHSTTIQPEFLDYHPGRDYILSEDCALACPKGPQEEDPACGASKCCPPEKGKSKSASVTPVTERRANNNNNSAANLANGGGGGSSSSSASAESYQRRSMSVRHQNNSSNASTNNPNFNRRSVPTNLNSDSPRGSSLPPRENHVPNFPPRDSSHHAASRHSNIDQSSSSFQQSPQRRNSTSNGFEQSEVRATPLANGSVGAVIRAGASPYTSTPAKPRPSAFNKTPSSPLFLDNNEITTELELSADISRGGNRPNRSSDPADLSGFNGFSRRSSSRGSPIAASAFDDENGGSEDSRETTPMFMPRSSSRVVRVISKQSNV